MRRSRSGWKSCSVLCEGLARKSILSSTALALMDLYLQLGNAFKEYSLEHKPSSIQTIFFVKNEHKL